jgi:hypothetical protein
VSQGLNREAAGDVEDVVQIEIAPSGVSVTYLSADLRANARKLELSARARARCRLRVGEPNGGRRRRKDRSASATRSSGGLG